MGRAGVWVAAAVGAVVGLVGHSAPLWVTGAVVSYRAPSCGMERALECTFDDAGNIVGALFAFLVALLVVTAAFAVAGTAAVVVGVLRARKAEREHGKAGPGALALVGAGAALVTPAAWLAGLVLAKLVS